MDIYMGLRQDRIKVACLCHANVYNGTNLNHQLVVVELQIAQNTRIHSTQIINLRSNLDPSNIFKPW